MRIPYKNSKGTKLHLLVEDWDGKIPPNPLKIRKDLLYIWILPQRPLISFWGSYLSCDQRKTP